MFSIRWQLLAIITIMLIALVAILTLIQIRSQEIVLREQLDKQNELRRQYLSESSKTLTLSLIQQGQNFLAAGNISAFEEAIHSGSTEILLYFFDKLTEQAQQGVAITVNWYYKSRQRDIREQGEEFQDEFTDLHFAFIRSSAPQVWKVLILLSSVKLT